MLGNHLWLRNSAPTAAFAAVSARRLTMAVTKLPAGWQVLRNRRLRSVDGPPWVKFIALHPEKGIALIDFLPAIPEAAIPPLDEFLARTGFGAFAAGDPPIVAVALGESDIEAIGDHLADAFDAAPPCGITNADWTEAVIELLLATRGLLLTRIMPVAERASAAPVSEPAILARSAPAPAASWIVAAPSDLRAAPMIAADPPRPPLVQAPGVARPRHLWLVPAALAATVIGATIGSVLMSRTPQVAPTVAEAGIAVSPAAAQTGMPNEAATSIAAPVPTIAAPGRSAKRRTRASIPVWEEQYRHQSTVRAPRRQSAPALADALTARAE